MDLPDNVTMTPFAEPGFSRQSNDRGIDMESTTYRQMNPHQNPYIQGQPRVDTMPLPEYGGNGARNPSYDFEQGHLGNHPQSQYTLPPKDIPLDMSGFRDESAKPNYVPPVQRFRDDYVLDQEERIRETKTSEKTQKTIDSKFDLLAEIQTPVAVAILYLVFQMNSINTLMARYLKFAGFFGEDGNINMQGMLFKSAIFGAFYYGVVNAAKFI
jgi:hypothetical protein